jgi:hypothetical protein
LYNPICCVHSVQARHEALERMKWKLLGADVPLMWKQETLSRLEEEENRDEIVLEINTLFLLFYSFQI